MDTTARRLLRRRGDGKYDGLYIQDVGAEKPVFQEGVYDEGQAKRALANGWQTVDDNGYLAARRLYGPKVEAPPGRAAFVPAMVGDAAIHPTAPPKPLPGLDEALRFAAEVGHDFSASVRPPNAPRTPAASPRPSLRPESPRVGLSARVSADESQRAIHRAQAGGAKAPESAAKAVYSPEVSAYVAKYTDGPDLAPAQHSADQRLLGARLARAGAIANTALTGSHLDDGYYDDLEKGAHQPVDDYLEQLRVNQAHGADERAREDQRLRGQQAERSNAADMRDFAFRDEEAKRQERLARDRMAQDKRQHADDLEERRRARWAVSARTQAKAVKTGGVDPKQLAELSKRSQDAAQMRADLETLGRHLGDQDIPGVGPIESAIPDLFLSEEGTATREAAERLYIAVQHKKFGTAVSPHEARLGLSAYGMGPGKSEDAFRKGMEALRQDAQESLGNIEAGFNPEVVERRRSLGGTTSHDMPSAAAHPTGKMRRGRDGRLWAEMSDGSAREVRR